MCTMCTSSMHYFHSGEQWWVAAPLGSLMIAFRQVHPQKPTATTKCTHETHSYYQVHPRNPQLLQPHTIVAHDDPQELGCIGGPRDKMHFQPTTSQNVPRQELLVGLNASLKSRQPSRLHTLSQKAFRVWICDKCLKSAGCIQTTPNPTALSAFLGVHLLQGTDHKLTFPKSSLQDQKSNYIGDGTHGAKRWCQSAGMH